MSEATRIEWCDSTFNPWVGCTKISPACDHCYAESWAKRSGQVEWGNHPRRRTTRANWREPLKWQAASQDFELEHGRRRRVFCASLADVFDNQVPDDWRADLWDLIERCWGMDWLLLTKRPQNIEKMLPDTPTWENIRRHVWLGTTVENQEVANRNIPHLLQHDAAVRFISYEPALGPIYIPEYMPNPLWNNLASWKQPEIDWVIAGGEGGPHARPSHPEWFRSIRKQCETAGVPFLFKQWGDWSDATLIEPKPSAIEDRIFTADREMLGVGVDHGRLGSLDLEWRAKGGAWMIRVGKKAAGRLLDGVEHNAFPVTDLARAAA